jgi:hypothetical protein
MKGDVKRKQFPPRAEAERKFRLHPAPRHLGILVLKRESCFAARHVLIFCFPSYKKDLFRTARSRQGRAERRGLRTLDGEDRSERIAEEGKQIRCQVDFRKRGKARRQLQVSTIVLSETRGLQLFSVVRGGIELTRRLSACAHLPTEGLDTLPRNASVPRIDTPTGGKQRPRQRSSCLLF